MASKTKPFLVVFCIFIFYTLLSPNCRISIDKIENLKSSSHRLELALVTCKPNLHSVCFFGKRFCHPGYTGPECSQKLVPANQYYTDCPNLKQDITFDINMPLEMFQTKDFCTETEKYKLVNGLTPCANLCFSHPVSGVPQVPIAFWKKVQENEANVWKGWGAGSDRGEEHLEGFSNYTLVPSRVFRILLTIFKKQLHDYNF